MCLCVFSSSLFTDIVFHPHPALGTGLFFPLPRMASDSSCNTLPRMFPPLSSISALRLRAYSSYYVSYTLTQTICFATTIPPHNTTLWKNAKRNSEREEWCAVAQHNEPQITIEIHVFSSLSLFPLFPLLLFSALMVWEVIPWVDDRSAILTILSNQSDNG